MHIHPLSRVAYTLHRARYIRTKHQDHFSQLKPANVVNNNIITPSSEFSEHLSAVHSPFNLVFCTLQDDDGQSKFTHSVS